MTRPDNPGYGEIELNTWTPQVCVNASYDEGQLIGLRVEYLERPDPEGMARVIAQFLMPVKMHQLRCGANGSASMFDRQFEDIARGLDDPAGFGEDDAA
jgi:hypothetical protein